MLYDLLIRGGTIIDGTGRPSLVADVGVQGDRIVAVGTLTESATQILEAAKRLVAPGFIDVHSHDDFALLDRPLCDFKVMQGVTTEVIGNCGFGAAPANTAYKEFLQRIGVQLFGPLGDFSWETTAEFYQALEACPASVNVAALIPHSAVRYSILGGEHRTPSAHELTRMQELMREGMEAGAVGLSTGLFYVPGRYAETEEIIALAQIVA